MSDPSPSVAKRAEQLARSGDYEFVYQIERKLKAEGYPGVEARFKSDPQIRQTLRDHWSASQSQALDEDVRNHFE